MVVSPRRRVLERWLVLGLFALVAMVAPVLHHDFACELKSEKHCDACQVTSPSAGIEPAIVVIGHTVPVRLAAPASVTARSCVAPPSSPGRAPPARAFTV